MNQKNDIIELSVKKGKYGTRTLSLVINRVILKKPAKKKYFVIQGAGEG